MREGRFFRCFCSWMISARGRCTGCVITAARRSGSKRREEETEINLSAGDFSLKRGWSDTPDTSELLEYHMEAGKESIRMCIENPGGKDWQVRTLTLDESAALRVTDEVFSFEGEILFSLPILAKDVSLTLKEKGRSGVHVPGTGYYGVDFELTAHRPVRKAWIEYGRVPPMHPGKESMIPYLRLTADAKTGFDCLIRGRSVTEPAGSNLTSQKLKYMALPSKFGYNNRKKLQKGACQHGRIEKAADGHRKF